MRHAQSRHPKFPGLPEARPSPCILLELGDGTVKVRHDAMSAGAKIFDSFRLWTALATREAHWLGGAKASPRRYLKRNVQNGVPASNNVCQDGATRMSGTKPPELASLPSADITSFAVKDTNSPPGSEVAATSP